MLRTTLFAAAIVVTLAIQAALSETLPTASQINAAIRSYEAALDSNDLSQAEESAELAYRLAREASIAPETLIILADNYATTMINAGRRSPTVIDVLSEEISLIEGHFGENDIQLIGPLRDRARIAYLIDREDRGPKEDFYRVNDLIDEHYAEPTVGRAFQLYQLAESRMFSGDARRGRRNLDEAREIYDSTLPIEDIRLGLAHHLTGRYEFAQKDYRDAATHLEVATHSLIPEGAPRNPAGLTALALLVQSYSETGREEEATEYCLQIGRLRPAVDTEEYQPLFKLPPAYPSSSARRHHEGYVIVEFDVDERGFVRNAKAIDTSFHRRGTPVDTDEDMITAAVEAATKFRYAPQFIDGEPVLTPGVKNRFTFELRN